ncbi:MAG: sodium:proton antiporter, partial [Patescibacteria group bacterium]|nr:sodium:proton antiporter [Patescibacteria group bacterium]
FALSVFGLLISTLIIGVVFKLALGLIGIDIPYFISFLFGAIISATDPVAVLSIFKEYGVPKRLSYLFEGESLINDGTAVALFLIILEMTMSGVFGMDSVLMGVYTFTTMLIGGILYGLFAGFFFSKVLQYVRNNMWVEITITLIMAHTTFITAELISEHFHLFQLSPIIATTVGALVLGNYGKYKISPKVEHMMDNFWGYFGFISNSLIFLLMGILIARLDMNFASMILPIIIAIVVVAVARFVSVYMAIKPLNNIWFNDPIPGNWIKLLSWGSLRGAIAITMVLLIDPNLTIEGWTLESTPRQFIEAITFSCIIFTLLIKATSIGSFIQKMGINDMSKEDEFTQHQVKEILDQSSISKLNNLHSKKYINPETYKSLVHKYELDDIKEQKEIEQCAIEHCAFERMIRKYALGIEKKTVLEAYEHAEIGERSLRQVLRKIEGQLFRIDTGKSQIKLTSEMKKSNIFELLYDKYHVLQDRYMETNTNVHKYMFYRTRQVTAGKVVKELKKFQLQFHKECNSAFDTVIAQYETWYEDARSKKQATILDNFEKQSLEREKIIVDKNIIHLQEGLIHSFYKKSIISEKVYQILLEDIQK